MPNVGQALVEGEETLGSPQKTRSLFRNVNIKEGKGKIRKPKEVSSSAMSYGVRLIIGTTEKRYIKQTSPQWN
jgi:hypothetical protein